MKSLSKKELRKILSEIFSILGLSEGEIEKTIENFQKRIAFELLESVKGELPAEYQDFLAKEASNISDPNHPMVAVIRKELEELHTKSEYLQKSKAILKGLIGKYVDHVSKGLSAENVGKLQKAFQALDKF